MNTLLEFLENAKKELQQKVSFNSYETPIVCDPQNRDVECIDEQQRYFKEVSERYKEDLKQRRSDKKKI